MKKIHKRLLVLFAIVLLLVNIIKPFNLKATISTNTHYSIEIENNALIYTFPDYHSSYNKEFIGLNGSPIVYRNENTLIANNEPIAPVSAYNYIWAWHFDLTQQAEGDFILYLNVYYLDASNFINGTFEHIDTYSYELSQPNATINIDYDSTLETFVDIGFNSSQLKDYLIYNGLQGGYSALGNLLNAYYQQGASVGYNQGINEQLANQNWWVELWDGVDAFLSVELLPNLTFGLLFSVPLVFGVLHLILFIWRSGD